MVFTLANIFKSYTVQVDTSHNVELEPLVTLRPKNGIKLIWNKRNIKKVS